MKEMAKATNATARDLKLIMTANRSQSAATAQLVGRQPAPDGANGAARRRPRRSPSAAAAAESHATTTTGADARGNRVR
jgi:hypothetical protein